MKRQLAILLAAAFVHAGFAADAKKPVPTPEQLIEQINAVLEDEGPVEVVSEKQFRDILKKMIANMDALAKQFRENYPEHPLRWQLRFHEAMMISMREEAGLPASKDKEPLAVFDEILAATDAPADVKSEAAQTRLIILVERVMEKKHPLEAWEKEAAELLKTNPGGDAPVMLAHARVDLVAKVAPERLDAVLAELAASADNDIAAFAKEKQGEAKAMAELRAKPLEFTFTALDGTEVDLAKLRGKVVLVDFWATWCGPCMAELPHVTAAYSKYKERGFEIVGISLDEDKDALKRALKKHKMTWPQHFDGKGWESAPAKRFGISSIPAMWLLDKGGRVADTNARDGLAGKIEALLAAEAK